MHEKEKIDILANGTKLLLDVLPLKEETRSDAREIVRITAEVLKCSIEARTTAVQTAQEAASVCGINRVVVFPCILNGRVQCLVRMYGGDIAAFCRMTNITLISDYCIFASPEIKDAEREYGVVLYERN